MPAHTQPRNLLIASPTGAPLNSGLVAAAMGRATAGLWLLARCFQQIRSWRMMEVGGTKPRGNVRCHSGQRL
jgi:hypothetical protein